MLAPGLIRDDLQTHLALARLGKQPPSSTPISLPVRTNCKSEPENEVGRRVGIGVAEVEANQPGAVRVAFAARGSRFAIALTGASCPDSGATAGRP